jgi:hypothetical protein
MAANSEIAAGSTENTHYLNAQARQSANAASEVAACSA